MKDNFTFFGKKIVDRETKTKLVNQVFSSVSSKYDLMNDLMSGGVHRLWKDIFCMMLDNPGACLLDVAGGTGDISKRFFKFAESQKIKPNITICDLNADMLEYGQSKLLDEGIVGINFINANAENLPFADESFDYYTVAFGIRNFSNISQSLIEAKRVLKKNGKFLCLEFSRPQNMLLSRAYSLYSKIVIPNLGGMLGDKESYQYLIESIQKFPTQEDFADMIKDAGFSNVAYRNLSNGIVAIHSATNL